jgi:Domain of unknown function (DUF4129)
VVLGPVIRHSVLATAAPPPITRDGEQRLARHELAKPPYHRHDPTWLDKTLSWLWDHLLDVFSRASHDAPGHGLGLGLVLVLLAVGIVAIVMRVGPLRRPTTSREPVFGDTDRPAADYRRTAAEYAAAYEWALAVRERLRAIARELEERGVLDPRPGRTADELCREASAQLPALATSFRDATQAFDAIWYGDVTARAADDELLRALDEQLTGPSRLLGRR